ncbi:beta-mannosidase isoform X2 [Lepeophtheirus salmonis]|uniref:beta-mannosidase isoform X2 n=1 Tax=Lepeophtheirus salmonis TaxID=72036 RepID=UPI003AF36060
MSNVSALFLAFLITFLPFYNTSIIDLSKYSWTLSQESLNLKVSNLKIPSGVYSDLIKGNVLPHNQNLYFRFNDEKYRWISYTNWTYSVSINLSTERNFTNVFLNTKGIDTVSNIVWNNQIIGTTRNMFKEYYFPISKKYIKHGENNLEIQFESPIKYSQRMSDKYYSKYGYKVLPECTPHEYRGECHVNFIRKMQSSYGWDWGPAYPSMGIWKPLYLILSNDYISINSIKWKTSLKRNTWRVKIQTIILTQSSYLTGKLQLKMAELGIAKTLEVGGNTDSSIFEGLSELKINTTMEFDEKSVQMWWPNGYGQQKLYNFCVTFFSNTSKVSKEIDVAFRSVKLVQEAITPKGLSFMFQVNGQNIFAKGSNWIPSHILPENLEQDRIIHLLEGVKKANMNMLRVWGGGVYESDRFYKLADSLGILIWQDFMFACSLYPSDKDFLIDVKEEVIQQVRRLQYHASIAIWAGNNENEAALSGNWYNTLSNFSIFKDDYNKLYGQTIQNTVHIEDFSRPFVKSSPSNGDGPSSLEKDSVSPYNSIYGDTHFYDYYSRFWDSKSYPSTRFASEYGFQSVSSLEDLNKVTEPDTDLKNVNSNFFVSREHHLGGLIQLKSQIESYLGLEESQLKNRHGVERFIYFSQIYQAIGLKVETEHYLRSKYTYDESTSEGFTMGALYWQLNDIWPGISWSTINYEGSWKMGHYYIKKTFGSPLVSPLLEENQIKLFIMDEKNILEPLKSIIQVIVQRWDSFQVNKIQIPVKTRIYEVKTFDLDHLLSLGNCGESGIFRLNYCYIGFSRRIL